ncbi:hypothetical protein HY642_05475 [Candidatus Woesearchaeota archaeon]|nr:hypothetical protein [Candidatus Woesearchaeota archaeon]
MKKTPVIVLLVCALTVLTAIAQQPSLPPVPEPSTSVVPADPTSMLMQQAVLLNEMRSSLAAVKNDVATLKATPGTGGNTLVLLLVGVNALLLLTVVIMLFVVLSAVKAKPAPSDAAKETAAETTVETPKPKIPSPLQPLKSYIQAGLQRGLKEDAVRRSALATGWTTGQFDIALKELRMGV